MAKDFEYTVSNPEIATEPFTADKPKPSVSTLPETSSKVISPWALTPIAATLTACGSGDQEIATQTAADTAVMPCLRQQ